MKSVLKKLLDFLGVRLTRIDGIKRYDSDGMQTLHNHEFLDDPKYQVALARALMADPTLGFMTWRLHVALWAASHAVRLGGDFVECGVNRGFLASAIMKYLDWNSLDRSFFLFDTFQGIATELLSSEEINAGRLSFNKQYSDCYKDAVDNFSEFQRVNLIRGRVPESLSSIHIDNVAFLSIDMNSAKADVAAFEFFWPKLAPCAVVLIDDYAYSGFEKTYSSFNDIAQQYGVPILSLPTGQGIMLKGGSGTFLPENRAKET
ncbi:TylF/MycF/NovP-related O-methyltransferase [Prosthecobacter sp.]|uniref:TylF/MycF/NovP-related O-methyltransferase n=1 Tax=Prosthecobacter sp. TaxID=1965333 RepID=UPI0037832B54